MQWIAMITMLIDHIGASWFEDQSIFRIIGRMAFPIYAYYVVQGMKFTSNRKRYVIRLGILALLSQAPFSLLFDTYTVNVIGTFFICVLGIYGFTEERLPAGMRYMSLILCAAVLLIVPCDYGIYALILMLIYRYASGISILLGHIALNAGFILAVMTSDIQAWSVLPSLVFAIPSEKVARAVREWRAPKLLWRAFYPGHLLALALLHMVNVS